MSDSYAKNRKKWKIIEEKCLSDSQQIPPKIAFCEQFQNRFVEGTQVIVKKESILDDCLATQKVTILSHFDTKKCWNLHCNFWVYIFEMLHSAKDNIGFYYFATTKIKIKVKLFKMKFLKVFENFFEKRDI